MDNHQEEKEPLIAQSRAGEAEANLSVGLAADKRDAERYRWLRKQHWNEAELCVVARPKDAVKLGYDCPSLDRLDAQIDAAIEVANGMAHSALRQ